LFGTPDEGPHGGVDTAEVDGVLDAIETVLTDQDNEGDEEAVAYEHIEEWVL